VKSCQGCTHLHEDKAKCRLGWQSELNPYTDRWMRWNNLTVNEARAEGGICGSDASKYEPKSTNQGCIIGACLIIVALVGWVTT